MESPEDIAHREKIAAHKARIAESVQGYYRNHAAKGAKDLEREQRRVARSEKQAARRAQGLPEARTEWHEQRDVCRWLGAAHIAYCAIPNGGKRDAAEGAHNKFIGVKRGMPDLLIFTPPPKHPTARGVAVEMKSLTGKATPEQLAWLEKLSRCGWVGYVAQGTEDAVRFLEGLGYGELPRQVAATPTSSADSESKR